MTKAYQCSQCAQLYDTGEYCMCLSGIDPRPNHREKGDAELCRDNFRHLEPSEQWHERFAWEK